MLFGLLTQTQTLDGCTVTLDILLLQIVEQITAATNHLQQTAIRMVILLVILQMGIQVIDATGQNCDLHLRGTGVTLVGSIGSDDFRLFFLTKHWFHLT